jgi:hypothetical protein
VHVNKDTGMSEKRQRLFDQSGESSCVKHNLAASNRKRHGPSLNTEIKVSENNFCKSESNFTHNGNIVVSVYLLCAFIKKSNCKYCDGNNIFLKNPSKWRGIVSN